MDIGGAALTRGSKLFLHGKQSSALSKPKKCQPACYIDHLCRHGTGQREGCIAVAFTCLPLTSSLPLTCSSLLALGRAARCDSSGGYGPRRGKPTALQEFSFQSRAEPAFHGEQVKCHVCWKSWLDHLKVCRSYPWGEVHDRSC